MAQMTQDQFIKQYKINNLMLANLLGIGRSAYSEKLRGLRGNKFTDEQKKKQLEFFKQMEKDLTDLKS